MIDLPQESTLRTPQEIQALIDQRKQELDIFRRVNAPISAIDQLDAIIRTLQWVLTGKEQA